MDGVFVNRRELLLSIGATAAAAVLLPPLSVADLRIKWKVDRNIDWGTQIAVAGQITLPDGSKVRHAARFSKHGNDIQDERAIAHSKLVIEQRFKEVLAA